MNRGAALRGLALLAVLALSALPSGGVAARSGADLAVGKAADTRTARVGDEVTYTITLANKGPETATGVVLGEGAPDQLGVTSFSCGGGTPVSQFAFACRYESLVKGQTVNATFVATVTLDAAPGDRVTNTAFVAESGVADPNSRNNADSATIRIVG